MRLYRNNNIIYNVCTQYARRDGRRNRRRGHTLVPRTHHSRFLFRYNFSVSSPAFRLPRSSTSLRFRRRWRDRVGRRRWHGDVQPVQVAGPVAGRSQVYTYSSFYNIIIIIIIVCTWRIKLREHRERARTTTLLVPETDNRWRYQRSCSKGTDTDFADSHSTTVLPPLHRTGRHPLTIASDGHRRWRRRDVTSTQYQQRLNDRVPVSLFPRQFSSVRP